MLNDENTTLISGIQAYEFKFVQEGWDMHMVLRYKFNNEWYTAITPSIEFTQTQNSPYQHIENIVNNALHTLVVDVNRRMREVLENEKLHY